MRLALEYLKCIRATLEIVWLLIVGTAGRIRDAAKAPGR